MKKKQFVRQEFGRIKRIKRKWKRPMGRKSKILRKEAGRRAMPSKGYIKSSSIRGKRLGVKPVLVENEAQLKSVKKGEGVVFSRSLGLKKKLDFINQAVKSGLLILNLKKPKEWAEKQKKDLADYKKKVQDLLKQKFKKKEEHHELLKKKEAEKKKAEEEAKKKGVKK